MARNKIALIGAGKIGGTLAHLAGLKELGDVVLFDIAEGVPQGKALDIAAVRARSTASTRSIDGRQRLRRRSRAPTSCIVTAGVPRKPGMSRDDLLGINLKVMEQVGAGIKQACARTPSSSASPTRSTRWSGRCRSSPACRSNKVVGMAGVLDSRPLPLLPRRRVQRLGRGRDRLRARRPWRHHGAADRATRPSPAFRCPTSSRWAGPRKEKLDAIVQRTRDGGGEIVGLLKTGSAFYAPAASAIAMAESYLKDKKRVLPCAAYLNGQYGVEGHLCRRAGGDRRRAASSGSSRSSSNAAEKAMFDKSVAAVQGLIDACKKPASALTRPGAAASDARPAVGRPSAHRGNHA